MMTNLIFFLLLQKLFLIAQMKRPDALNATQKPPASNNVWFRKKLRNTSKNDHFLQFWFKKNGNFWRLFKIFIETMLCKELGFFALHSVHQD